MDVSGRAAIVTGGGTGLGAAAAELLSAAGARVAVLGRRSEIVEAQAAKIGGLGISCDVGDAASTEHAFELAHQAHGPAQILVNAAGIGPFGPVLRPDGSPMPLEDFERVIKINLTGHFNAIRLAARDMLHSEPSEDGERGVIINTSSIAGQDGGAGAVPYTASKGGIDAMTLALAREFGDAGIRVVTICPGPFDTPLIEEVPEAMRDGVSQFLVFPKRIGRTAEYARLALHICENGYINGALIRLDGGMRTPFFSASEQ
jgi:NAD(P)-dependent dehydrogenase (short-subunit alcohol dehydrogenase family)